MADVLAASADVFFIGAREPSFGTEVFGVVISETNVWDGEGFIAASIPARRFSVVGNI